MIFCLPLTSEVCSALVSSYNCSIYSPMHYSLYSVKCLKKKGGVGEGGVAFHSLQPKALLGKGPPRIATATAVFEDVFKYLSN